MPIKASDLIFKEEKIPLGVRIHVFHVVKDSVEIHDRMIKYSNMDIKAFAKESLEKRIHHHFYGDSLQIIRKLMQFIHRKMDPASLREAHDIFEDLLNSMKLEKGETP
jgi:hypothetical protein